MNRENSMDQVFENVERSLLFVATSDKNGVPHVTAAKSISRMEAGRIAVTDWFCPQTVANAVIGHPVSIVIWDPNHDKGHQIIGRVITIDDLAIMDGYQPGKEDTAPIPQQLRRLVIEVHKVMVFCRAPHSDTEI